MSDAVTTTNSSPHDHSNDGARVLYHHLVDEVLCGVIDGDTQVMEDIRRYGKSLRLVDGEFQFTLPALFEFASARCEQRGLHAAADVDYRSFRRTLYDNPTNAVLRQHGGLVEVARENTDHTVPLYRLVQAG
jgi:hypothetical protein